jgi:hypothetical protein
MSSKPTYNLFRRAVTADTCRKEQLNFMAVSVVTVGPNKLPNLPCISEQRFAR